jgi:hypothetical protein
MTLLSVQTGVKQMMKATSKLANKDFGDVMGTASGNYEDYLKLRLLLLPW